MIRDDDEVGQNKHFSVKLDAVEGGTLDAWWRRVRVSVRVSYNLDPNANPNPIP